MLVVENQLIRFFCKIGGSSGKSGDLATLTHRPRGLYSFVQFESRFGLGQSVFFVSFVRSFLSPPHRAASIVCVYSFCSLRSSLNNLNFMKTIPHPRQFCA